jgi:hypothetical protein
MARRIALVTVLVITLLLAAVSGSGAAGEVYALSVHSMTGGVTNPEYALGPADAQRAGVLDGGQLVLDMGQVVTGPVTIWGSSGSVKIGLTMDTKLGPQSYNYNTLTAGGTTFPYSGAFRYVWILNTLYPGSTFSVDAVMAVQADPDGDGVLTGADNCPLVANADQLDFDDDGVGDACDNCRLVANPNQADWNNNGIGDACEDADGDLINDALDNCPDEANADQLDFDGDGQGDACDTPSLYVSGITASVRTGRVNAYTVLVSVASNAGAVGSKAIVSAEWKSGGSVVATGTASTNRLGTAKLTFRGMADQVCVTGIAKDGFEYYDDDLIENCYSFIP